MMAQSPFPPLLTRSSIHAYHSPIMPDREHHDHPSADNDTVVHSYFYTAVDNHPVHKRTGAIVVRPLFLLLVPQSPYRHHRMYLLYSWSLCRTLVASEGMMRVMRNDFLQRTVLKPTTLVPAPDLLVAQSCNCHESYDILDRSLACSFCCN